ncbi:MAG TPA: PrsW family glutamic-type intramembrane protease, partial [Actinomycetota bacterium]|nr:PrsW family glutamic-type intramembrane protease [Actinomycetota bacterium]
MSGAAAAPVPRVRRRAFLRPLEPAFWVFVVFLGVGAVTTARTLADLSGISRSGWVLAWVLLAIYAVPIAILVYRLDLYEREPLALAAAAFAWGALGATGLSIQAAGWNDAFAAWLGPDAAGTWGPAVITPTIEEILKAAGLVLLVFIARDEFDDMMDGFVYGALAGLGFAVVEDV